jgi:hypothetical protein
MRVVERASPMRRKGRKKPEKDRGNQKTIRVLARPYLALMLRQKEMDEQTSLRLKAERDEVLDVVIAHAKRTRANIVGCPQPQSVADLGGRLPTNYSRDTSTEVRWAISTAMQYCEELGDFLESKEQIERMMVNGAWSAADALLQAVQTRLGKSMWGIETNTPVVAAAQCRPSRGEPIHFVVDSNLPRVIHIAPAFVEGQLVPQWIGVSTDETCNEMTGQLL